MAQMTRQELWTLLGWPDGPMADGRLIVKSRASAGGFDVCDVAVETEKIGIPGTLLLPLPGRVNRAAILYCHAHGNRYDIGAAELMKGRPALQDPPYGPVLAQAGFAVLCIEMPGFGHRQHEGTEDALAKAQLWHGRTLFGQMLSELSAALTALTSLEGVEPARIATLGISMGATHAWWLAALDDRVAACAHQCAFADIAPLIKIGGHDLHRPYLTVPNLLSHTDFGDIAATIAPRPQWVGSGAQDPITPPQALNPALEKLRQAYAKQGVSDRLMIFTSPKTGHEETAAMRTAILEFLPEALNL